MKNCRFSNNTEQITFEKWQHENTKADQVNARKHESITIRHADLLS